MCKEPAENLDLLDAKPAEPTEPVIDTEPQEKPELPQHETEESRPQLPPLPNITTICSLGYTGKSAEDFYGLLTQAGVTLLVDVRQNPGGPRSFHTLKRDLPYFLGLHNIRYVHLPILAPTKELREAYHASDKTDWSGYVSGFTRLMAQRKVLADQGVRAVLDGEDQVICFLCSEHQPDKCHRSLVIEMILRFHQAARETIRVVHLVKLEQS